MSQSTKKPPISVGRMALWMLRYPVRRKFALTMVLLMMLVGNGMRLLSPWPMKVIIDNVINGMPLPPSIASLLNHLPLTDSREGLLGWSVAGIIFLFFTNWLIGLVSALTNLNFGQRMIYDLAADLFGHLQRLSLRFHGSRSVGDLIRRVTNDCGCVAVIVRDAMLPVLSSIVMLISMFLLMWEISHQLAVLSLAVVPLMLLSFRMYAKPMLASGYAQQEADGVVYTVVERALYAIPVVQAFCAEDRNERALRSGTDVALDAILTATRVQMGFKIAIGLATAIGTAGIIWIGSSQIINGPLTVGDLLVFLAYLGLLYGPLNAMMYTGSTIQSAAGSAWRVIEIFETDHEVRDAPGARALSRPRGDVRFECVSFGYEKDRAVLLDIDLHLPQGSTVAIVGTSGAGKSTLASMVPRFFDPWAGRVTLEGQDLKELKLQDLRANVAVVLQEPFLFPLTISQNIAYGSPHATSQRIEAAARAAGAHEFITRLPQKYDTLIGERGATLSGGERQRVSIARALLKDAPVLILDEPTASLDAATEAGLLEALKILMHGRTTLVIAHRLSTIRDADMIVAMEHGRIVERGKHEQLLAAGGIYSRLYRLQMHDISASTGVGA